MLYCKTLAGIAWTGVLGIAKCEYPVQRCWIEHIGMHWIAGNSKVDKTLSTDSSSIMSSPVTIVMSTPPRMMIRGLTTESLIWRLSVSDVWESGETTQGFLPHRCCSRPKEGHDDHHYPNPPHLSNSNEGFYNLLMTFPWPPHLGGSWFLIMQLFLKGKQASTQMDICLLPNHIKKFSFVSTAHCTLLCFIVA